MSTKAKLYIHTTIVISVLILAGCLIVDRQFPDPPRYFGYLMLVCLGSTLKIKLPKITGTMSISFLIILIGVAELALAETITLGCAAALIQSLWKPRKRPALIQVLFNIATLTTSIALTFTVAHALAGTESLVVLLSVAVCIYFITNTSMISLVLSLIEQKPFVEKWRACFMWSFPYYLAGAVIAGTISMASRTVGWKTSLLVLPIMYLTYSYYRMSLLRYQQD